MNNNLIH